MKWQRWITLSVVVVALAGLAAWQWDEHGHECNLARQTVSRSADSVMNALVGGVRSHRRLGQFFADNMQDVLDGLARSPDVRAVALVSEDGKSILSAGDAHLLDLSQPFSVGEYWDPTGFRVVKVFNLPSETAGPGGGFGGGRGRGRRWQEEENTPSSFLPGKAVATILLVDRERADAACRHSAYLRGSIVVAGTLVVLCVALAWRATVRLAQSRERERSLATEARHYRELSQAAAGLAHETRNPLGLIRGWTQRLADEQSDDKTHGQRAQAIIEECDRLTARINQFLAFARPSEPALQRFDPAEVATELGELLDPDLSDKRVTFRGLAPGATIYADREMFRQVLFNLLQNAIQASPEGGNVAITMTRSQDGHLRIEVADQGPGVDADMIEKLFTPYFTTRQGGTGLGLAIVRRIAASHGWETGYAPRPGGGAIFWLDGIHG
jgi:two-component system, NtrC family, sensor histidine kinase HydH